MYADRPIITMSMSGMGVISRLCGEIFGSALTFGAAKSVSAYISRLATIL
ncbi:type I 3-dehydroquinate dehydratase [Clostridioides difficile]